MLDELAQGWTGRDASVDDWLADVSGALLGIVAGSQLARLLVQK
jgi:VanZ family protein